jgi:hypothetical protein
MKLMIVSHMMKLFGQDYKRESGGMREFLVQMYVDRAND